MKLLFIYGTLLSPHVFHKVTGENLSEASLSEAALWDYKSYYVQGEQYPGVKPCPGEKLTGRLVRASPESFRDILKYEGQEEYTVKTIRVETPEGMREAEAFLSKREVKLSQKAWDFEDWKQKIDITKYLEDVENWLK